MERQLKSKLPNGAFENVSQVRSRVMSSIRGKNNKTTELRLKMALVREGIKGWRTHCRQIPGRPDFFFPKQKVAIFVDGCFWHACPRCGHCPKTRTEFWQAKLERNKGRDAKTTRKLIRSGVRVLRIWEHSLRDSTSIRQILVKILKQVDLSGR